MPVKVANSNNNTTFSDYLKQNAAFKAFFWNNYMLCLC